jgi:hypothetical protein
MEVKVFVAVGVNSFADEAVSDAAECAQMFLNDCVDPVVQHMSAATIHAVGEFTHTITLVVQARDEE